MSFLFIDGTFVGVESFGELDHEPIQILPIEEIISKYTNYSQLAIETNL